MRTSFTVKTKNTKKHLSTEVTIPWATTIEELVELYGAVTIMAWARRGKTLATHIEQWNEMDNPAKVAARPKEESNVRS